MSMLFLAGACMQSYANGTIDAVLASLLFLFAGGVGVALVFPCKTAELRAFLLSYSICILVGGLAQCYSLAIFDNLQSTRDAHTFFGLIAAGPPFTTWADLEKNINYPLAIVVWQQVYRLAWSLGFVFGPYTGVILNALVMGVTGSITVRTARELFGDDAWRLKRVGTFFALCGLFILFGSILLRDCFTSILNAVLLWGLVRWLCTPTSKNMFFAIAVTGISGYAMAYLRFESIVLLGVFFFMSVLFWFMKSRFNATRVVAAYFALSVVIIGFPYLRNYLQMSQKYQAKQTNFYKGAAASSSEKDSLAMQFVVNQPMPIRLVMGSGSLMVYPIPLWGYFRTGLNDYHLIKAYHGLYQVVVMPFIFAGAFLAARAVPKDRRQSIPLLFLAAYLLVNVMAVAATTLEQRHLAQFLPASCILAAVPDTREFGHGVIVQRFAVIWLLVVLLVHVAWIMAGGIRISF